MGAILASQLVRHPQERAVEHCAIVIGEIDQSRLHDQPAEFDELARAFASLDLPLAHSASRLRRFKPMPYYDQAPHRSLRRDQVPS